MALAVIKHVIILCDETDISLNFEVIVGLNLHLIRSSLCCSGCHRDF